MHSDFRVHSLLILCRFFVATLHQGIYTDVVPSDP
jgi:hypothetical protein